jgi:hypothetical protein
MFASTTLPPPELSSRIEEIQTIKEWLRILVLHTATEQKEIISDLHSEGFISFEAAQSLFSILNLAEA